MFSSLAYKKQVILNQIVPKIRFWKGSICHTSHELVVRVLLPGCLNILAIEEIVDESTSTRRQLQSPELRLYTYGMKGRV